MKFLVFILFIGLVSTSLGNPDSSLSLRQRRDVDILANTKGLIQELITNLQNSAQQARAAIKTFIKGIQQQITLFKQKVQQDLQKLKDSILESIKNITNKITSTGPAIIGCIKNGREAVEQLFAKAHEKSNKCADDRVLYINKMVDDLSSLCDGAANYTSIAVKSMQSCNENNSGLLSVGRCLGSLVVKTEYKGVMFAAQSSLMISRINLSLVTLPAALEVCSGTSLLSIGSEARTIVSDVATCSFSSIFSSPNSSS
ncbi:uncharacterized protein LOC119840616 [Zerene cesonia]|uniref:uncharacterized protein LOC119840616 n=1 Tax=Zerene cesonia TaxID=33412 RepID=UPI0018E593A8|nr:uncharacterized protein LOC119840616 [Zerene cesonia]